MGTMAALTIFVALLFDLFFMPAILLLLKPLEKCERTLAVEAQ
jgi:hypothetical protein